MLSFYAFDADFVFVGEVAGASAVDALEQAKAQFPKSSGLMVQPKTKLLTPQQLEHNYQIRSGIGPGSRVAELPPINLLNMPTPRRRRTQ